MKNQFEIVDFHSHILPSADHGSSSVETSLFQLSSALGAGVTRIIATPHFYPHVHTVDAFLERREAAYKALIPHIPNGVEIRLAAEVLICPGIHNLPGLEKLFIHGTNTLLLEISNTDFGPEHLDTVRELIGKGIDVVLAHADRYNPSYIEQLIELGISQVSSQETVESVSSMSFFTLAISKQSFPEMDLWLQKTHIFGHPICGINMGIFTCLTPFSSFHKIL